MKANVKRTIMACVLVVCFLGGSIPASGEQNTDNAVTATLSTYDGSKELCWGFGYSNSYQAYPAPTQVDDDYVGLGADGKRSLREESESWSKYWLRVQITPAADPEGVTTPLFGQTMRVLNVQIGNADAIGMYCKTEMRMTADVYRTRYHDFQDEGWSWSYGSYLPNERQTRKSAKFWEARAQRDETEWIMEVVIDTGHQTEKQIQRLIRKAEITFDVEISDEQGVRKLSGIPLKTGKAVRETRLSKGRVSFIANVFGMGTEADLPYVVEDRQYNRWATPDEEQIIAKIRKAPENYAVININVWVRKDMNWGLCNIAPVFSSFEAQGMYLIWSEIDRSYDNDLWLNGEYFIINLCVVIETQGKTDQEIKKMLRTKKVEMSFSTEFAGMNQWDGTRPVGCPGIPFTVKIDMSGIKTFDEVQDELAGSGDG